MGRLAVACTLFAVALGLLGGAPGCGRPAPPRPDLVLITVDRLAADRLHCFGGPVGAGASICALGRGGTLFAWTASPGLGEASAAASLLTGLDRRRHGLQDDGQSFLADRQQTFVEDVARAGYATAAFIASPGLNHSRRLDQGFQVYDDRASRPSDAPEPPSLALASRVEAWLERAASPRLLWIHAAGGDDIEALDRLVARLAPSLERDRAAPALVFVALRGEAELPDDAATEPGADPGRATSAFGASARRHGVDWRSHRVPLIWRPPGAGEAGASNGPGRISRRLASLLDIAPTLRAVAHVESAAAAAARGEDSRDLRRLALPLQAQEPNPERFLLLEAQEEVGLATAAHLYRRRTSPLDGSARPVPTEGLRGLDARFASVPLLDPIRDPVPDSARLRPGRWREDVLSPESPVPRLEFHLAQRLARASAEVESTR